MSIQRQMLNAASFGTETRAWFQLGPSWDAHGILQLLARLSSASHRLVPHPKVRDGSDAAQPQPAINKPCKYMSGDKDMGN